jgi:hypothetical protein
LQLLEDVGIVGKSVLIMSRHDNEFHPYTILPSPIFTISTQSAISFAPITLNSSKGGSVVRGGGSSGINMGGGIGGRDVKTDILRQKSSVRTSVCVRVYPTDAFLLANGFLLSMPTVKNASAPIKIRPCERTPFLLPSPPLPPSLLYLPPSLLYLLPSSTSFPLLPPSLL